MKVNRKSVLALGALGTAEVITDEPGVGYGAGEAEVIGKIDTSADEAAAEEDAAIVTTCETSTVLVAVILGTDPTKELVWVSTMVLSMVLTILVAEVTVPVMMMPALERASLL